MATFCTGPDVQQDLAGPAGQRYARLLCHGTAGRFGGGGLPCADRLARDGVPAATGHIGAAGGARHNSFIALALAASLFGPQGFETAILASAILIPVTNVTVVVLMVIALQPGKRGSLPVAILRDLARNPHIISISLALLANRFVEQEIPVLHEMTGILGKAAPPITLLVVGANLRVRAMAAIGVPLALAFIGKMLVFPAATPAIGLALGLSGTSLRPRWSTHWCPQGSQPIPTRASLAGTRR